MQLESAPQANTVLLFVGDTPVGSELDSAEDYVCCRIGSYDLNGAIDEAGAHDLLEQGSRHMPLRTARFQFFVSSEHWAAQSRPSMVAENRTGSPHLLRSREEDLNYGGQLPQPETEFTAPCHGRDVCSASRCRTCCTQCYPQCSPSFPVPDPLTRSSTRLEYQRSSDVGTVHNSWQLFSSPVSRVAAFTVFGFGELL